MRSTCLTACVLFAALPAFSQVTTATFYGIVTDSTGAVVPGASVTFLNDGTASSQKQVSSDAGEFVFDLLRVGTYTIRIEAQGFKAFTATGLELAAAQHVRRTFGLQVGSVSETVNVDSTTPLVNTVSAEQRESVDGKVVAELPLSRRNYTNLLSVGTGVTVSNAGSAPGHGNRDGGVRLNGLGRSATTFTVDGTDANGNAEGRSGALFTNFNYIDTMSIEAVQEVQVVKGIIPAEYGQALSGNVNLISKSGTNSFHGSLFENFQAENLNARNQFLTYKAPMTFNQFGGSAGGRVKRDRIFFFGAYEGYREASSSLVSGNVPTARFRQELLTRQPQYKPALDATPLPTEPHAATADVGFYQAARPARAHDNHAVVKGDFRVTNNSNLALTYTRGRPFRDEPMIYTSNNTEFHGWQERGTASFVTGAAAWTSESRFGYNAQDLETFDAFLGKGVEEDTLYGRRYASISSNLGFSTPASQIWTQYGPGISIEQKVGWHRGLHSFKFGGDYFFRTGGRVKVNNPVISYLGREDLLNDVPNSMNYTFGMPYYNGNNYEFGFFAQDDWRITPKLVINLGARYDFYSAMVARGFDSKSGAGLFNLDGLRDDKFTFGPFRDPERPYNNDAGLNIGPRVGFSYNPDGKGITTIRGGFGILFSPQMMGTLKQAVATKTVPYRVVLSRAEAQRYNLKFLTFNDDARKVVEAETARTGKVNVFAAIDPNLQNPYSMNLYFGIQRALTPSIIIESAFVANRGVKFIMQRTFNQVDRITGERPNPNLGQGYYIDNTQNTVYASWQTSIRKRYTRNLSGAFHYTWGKALSTAGGDIGAVYQGDQNERTQDFFNPRADRGPSTGDITHYGGAEFVYDLPQLAALKSNVLRGAMGGWQVSGILTAATGEPLIITQASSLTSSRPDYIGGPAVLDNNRDTLQYLNPAAFARVPIGSLSGATLRPGTIGQGAVRGPGNQRFDLSFGKNFSVAEKMRLQVRADAFNAFNHTNFVGLTTAVENPRFGKFTSTRGARVVQLSARISF
ncbi:MAG: TonB-dependent receptor plug [Bryobacterales bacterium]|nr:TonB-dependent receptor plug [Bryobacterales bacterium]